MNVARAMVLAVLAALAAVLRCAAAEPALFESRQLTPSGEYTSGIEGPSVDAGGTLYVVNFQHQGTIGKLSPGAAQSELFAALPAGSVGNGIRFDRDGRMYVADWKNHNVFVFERDQPGGPRVYFHSDGCSPGGQLPCFNEPNDLAVTADGTLYASDPNFANGKGQIWRITRGPDGNGRGEVMLSSERQMGATNGVDLSPDGATLYVSESSTPEDCKPPSTARCVWAYRLDGATLTAPRLVKRFKGFDLDGLRTDLDGKIFVTRPGNGTVVMLAPDGTLVREIPLQGKKPSNLTFGGPDGKTVFVTQGDGRFIETFRVERPGREPCLQTPNAC